MKFRIVVNVDRKKYRMWVERIYQSDQIEKYRVTGGQRSIVLQTNGPLMKKRHLKHRKGQWKLIEGQAWNMYALQEVIDTIQQYLDLNREL